MEKVLVCAEGVVALLVQQSAGEYSVHPALGAGQTVSAGTERRGAGGHNLDAPWRCTDDWAYFSALTFLVIWEASM